MNSILCNKSSFAGATKVQSSKRSVTRTPLVVRAQQENVDVSRRATIGSLAGAAALLSSVAPSMAAFGDAANVFGKVTNTSGATPYAGEGFTLLLPFRWNPSKLQEFPGTLLRYDDNFDVINCINVMANPTDKGKISDYGTPEKFLESVGYLLGRQSYEGETRSEGGFAPNRVSAASILDVAAITDKKGKEYYTYNILTRTADGDEGGKHNLIKATVSDGKLWILKIQIGDKRWIFGKDKEAMLVFNSFTVA